ncbi:uncharacterized protein A4U43_C06F15940 [Asparagus officinalis]|uniref:Uncharacterized protein n=1 Tax=Asparagus officinalis TaxID=4686 RepID=A0A5P1EM93_ASPOF|nr:uncharacterized protein A4U43_C06F15940 [Asparagus officinalis]
MGRFEEGEVEAKEGLRHMLQLRCVWDKRVDQEGVGGLGEGVVDEAQGAGLTQECLGILNLSLIKTLVLRKEKSGMVGGLCEKFGGALGSELSRHLNGMRGCCPANGSDDKGPPTRKRDELRGRLGGDLVARNL